MFTVFRLGWIEFVFIIDKKCNNFSGPIIGLESCVDLFPRVCCNTGTESIDLLKVRGTTLQPTDGRVRG